LINELPRAVIISGAVSPITRETEISVPVERPFIPVGIKIFRITV
jgi:hypothetical protein